MDAHFALRYPLRLLLVEDDPINRKLMTIMLRRLGYETLAAQDGVEAVEIYQRERPDCILMDLQMPRKDGFEAAAEIRKIEHLASRGEHVYIFALTANTIAEDRKRCFDMGMDDFISKPISRSRLAETLMQVKPHGI
ncbi:MAG: response regulator [Chthoniobacterales bacterium]